MLDRDQAETVEIWDGAGWVKTDLTRLEEGDLFRIRKADGDLRISAETNTTVFRCLKTPTIECRGAVELQHPDTGETTYN